MKVKVIIDTNVLISAILRDRDPEKIILSIISQQDLEWIASIEILTEYKEVLSRKKFALPQQLLKQWFSVLDSIITIVNVNLKQAFPRDTKDAVFLAYARATNADFLITGDSDFSEAEAMLRTKVVSVSQFSRYLNDVFAIA